MSKLMFDGNKAKTLTISTAIHKRKTFLLPHPTFDLTWQKQNLEGAFLPDHEPLSYQYIADRLTNS